MSITSSPPRQAHLLALLPVAIDALTLLALLLTLPPLAARLLQPNGWNAALLVTLYTLFCLGVYLIRKLQPQPDAGRWAPPAWFMAPRVRGILGALFGLLMMTTLAYQLGYFASLNDPVVAFMGEGDSSAFMVYGPGAWLGFSMLVILVLAFPVSATIPPGTPRYPLIAALGLLCTNAMLLIAAAQARAIAESFDRLGSITAVVATFAALLLSFLPARLLYQDRQPYLSGLLSFALLLLAATWLAAV